MRRIILVLVLAALAGCDCGGGTGACSKGGCKRYVTLYSNDGKAIQTWETTEMFAYSSGFAIFNVNGQRVYVSGTIVSEKK